MSKIHGVIDQRHVNRKTDYLFRVSIKALIHNNEGKVLVVKEAGRMYWDLPGGGMDHEEDIKGAIARELYEEVCLRGDFTYRVVAVEEPKLLPTVNVWQLRLVFEVQPADMTFKPGDDGDALLFIDPSELKDSQYVAERRVYEYSLLASR